MIEKKERRKTVVKFFVLLALLVVLLGILHFVHFNSLTAFSIFEEKTAKAEIVPVSDFYWIGLGIVSFLALAFVARFIVSHHNRIKKIPYVKEGGQRYLIEIDLRK